MRRHVYFGAAVVGLSLFCVGGCEKEPTAEGKTRSEIVAMSKDLNQQTAERAMGMLVEYFPNDATAAKEVAEMRKAGYQTTAERLKAENARWEAEFARNFRKEAEWKATIEQEDRDAAERQRKEASTRPLIP